LRRIRYSATPPAASSRAIGIRIAGKSEPSSPPPELPVPTPAIEEGEAVGDGLGELVSVGLGVGSGVGVGVGGGAVTWNCAKGAYGTLTAEQTV